MPEIGQTISHYRIVEKIGQGGMGEVYLADDTTLDRKVALKFLPDAFTSDPERMARFEREAKLLASLNHPNIAGIYGLEQAEGNRFLVLEYVEGETLQARLSKGALPLEDALELCRQIAEGLEAAHEKGVIHRDLKPANVMITAEEKVKILDFGLAKALSDDTQSIDSSQSPTLTEAMTRPGVILGTAAYMSPEQAKGKNVDKRADIWAFGCILYECLTGKKAFEGETVTETLAAVIKEEPDWNLLPETTPQNIRFVLRRCMGKEKNRRFHHAADVRIEIEETRDIGEKAQQAKKQHPWLVWTVAALAVIVLLTVVYLHFSSRETAGAKSFHLSVPTMQIGPGIAISPDGSWIAFTASDSGSETSLFLCEVGSTTPRQMPGTEGALDPFWSPDSRLIAFFAEGRIKKVGISGGSPQDICASRGGFGGSWNQNDTIIFSQYPILYSVSASGGEPIAISTADTSIGEAAHILPRFLPDGRHYLYTAFFETVSKNSIYVGSLDSEEKTWLLSANSKAAYSETGHLVFHREGTLFAQPFDVEHFTVTGDAVNIAENLLLDDFGLAAFDISQNGVLISRSAEGSAESQFVWFDRNGKEIESAGEPGMYLPDFDLSPDGKQIAFIKQEPASLNRNVWLMDWTRNVSEQLTFDPTIEDGVVWSPDGKQIAFSSMRKGSADIYIMKPSGTGEATIVLDSPEDEWVTDWSKDNYLAYTFGIGDTDILVLPLFGDEKPLTISQAINAQAYGRFSHDGKWLAYQSNESGSWQIYVTSFPGMDQRRTISNSEGVHPEWRQDGKELYYLNSDGKMMVVELRTDKKIEPGIPRELFNTHLNVHPNKDPYAITPDGQSFLLLKPLTDPTSTPIKITFNWPSLLEK